MKRRPESGKVAERELLGVDDAGHEERILLWIERRPGAAWAVCRAVNPQHRADAGEPRPEDLVFEGYELADASSMRTKRSRTTCACSRRTAAPWT